MIEAFVAKTHAGERAFASTVAAAMHGFLERLDVDDRPANRFGATYAEAETVLEHAETETVDEAAAATDVKTEKPVSSDASATEAKPS